MGRRRTERRNTVRRASFVRVADNAPLTYAEILIDRSTYYGADDVSDLIGKTYYCGRNADVESADGSFSDSGLMRYADFEICGIFDDGLTDREAFFALASDENAERT